MLLNNKNHSIMIYESNSQPYSISFVEWTALWWKWLVSIPKERSPASDATGQFCNTSQYNPKVWFLAGTFGGSAVRNCTIPYGRAILFPIINYECSFADEPSITSEKGLEERCKLEIDQIANMDASLDGRNLDVRKFRVQSGCFTVDLPSNNCLGAIPGSTRMASDGYWLFIEALPIGIHVLTSFGSCLEGRIKIGCTFQVEIK